MNACRLAFKALLSVSFLTASAWASEPGRAVQPKAAEATARMAGSEAQADHSLRDSIRQQAGSRSEEWKPYRLTEEQRQQLRTQLRGEDSELSARPR